MLAMFFRGKIILIFLTISLLVGCQKDEISNLSNLNIEIDAAKGGGSPKGGKPDVSSSIKNGIVAWFPFNNNVNDVSGNGNHLQNFGAVLTTDRFGNPNSAYDFQNEKYVINSFLEAYNSTNFKQPSYTYSAWFNTNEINFPSSGSDQINQTILGFIREDWTYGNPFDIYLRGDQLMTSQWVPGNQWFTGLLVGQTTITSNTWNNVVVTYDGLNVSLYLNGNIIGQHTAVLSYDYGTRFMIGAMRDGPTPGYYNMGFIGKLDDVGFWNRPLKGNEIQYLYKNGSISF